jgi:hypothetical protein
MDGSVRFQEKIISEGHVDEHVGVAVNGEVFPPTTTAADGGETATEFRITTVIAAEASLMTPFRVTLTKSPTLPAVVFAVKRTGFPEDLLRVPSEGLESAHE